METLLTSSLTTSSVVFAIIFLLFLLQVKHLVVDWLWQPEYEWKNKGTYGHWGGIRHALKNGLGTSLCFAFFVSWPIGVYVLIIDTLVHYHIDWAKMNLNRINKWDANTPQFFQLIGVDQFLHQVTYLLLIVMFL